MDAVLAHGVGGVENLPIPFEFVLIGAAGALGISSVILAFAWRSSRFSGDQSGRPLPAPIATLIDSRPFRWGLRGVCGAAFLYVATAAVFGPDLDINPTIRVLYVLMWVGIPLLSLAVGPFWSAVNPLRTIHAPIAATLRLEPGQGVVRLPGWVGYWPATAMLLGFVWMELVSPTGATLPTIRVFLALYVAVSLLGAVVFGSSWFARADMFEVYSTLVGRLSVLGRRRADDQPNGGDQPRSGQLVIRNPLANLDGLTPRAGLTGFVSVLLGSTAWDSFGTSTTWLMWKVASDIDGVLLDTVGLVVACLVVLVTLSAATMATGALGRRHQHSDASQPAGTLWELPNLYAHSVIPIAVGYVTAHYLTLLVIEGQAVLIHLSDPLSMGWNVFGTAGRGIDYTVLFYPNAIAVMQVLAVVVGHLLGTVAAHDRAVRHLPRAHAIVGQLPLLILMVGYTVGGLLLLFS